MVRGTWCIIAYHAYSARLRGQLSSNVRPRIPHSLLPRSVKTMRRTFIRLLAVSLLGLTACTATMESSRRVGDLSVQPTALNFIWSASKPPTFSNLPALGAALPGTPHSTFFANYAAEHASFGTALQLQVQEHPSTKGRSSVSLLPANHTSEQHADAIKRTSQSSAVILVYPERVTSFCLPGCFAFKMRVAYLAPQTRAIVWTGLIDVPPKTKHSDPFDAVAGSFTELLLKPLANERLLVP